MEGIDPIFGFQGNTQTTSVQQTANDGFGLAFEDLLQIVLTQLTFQDPLKPIDNFEFVSQLAQFTQIQQTETLSDRTLSLLQTEGSNQATGLLGNTVDIGFGAATISGRVSAVSFSTGEPLLTIETSGGGVRSGISLAQVSQVRAGS